MKEHIFERAGRPVTLEGRLESEPLVLEEAPACPVCGTPVDLESLEHSIRAKPLQAREGKPTSVILMCSIPCFNESCPVYLKLEVTISEEEFETWSRKPDSRLDHTYFRDGRAVTMEARADETISGEPPERCPVCLNQIRLADLVPSSEVLISGMPLPRPDGPPQFRASAYTSCPHCKAHLTCSCFASAEEVADLKANP